MNKKILLIEDEEKIARFTELELKHEGYEVAKAFNGRDGLAMAETEEFDLVLLYIMLPELDKVSGLDAGADDYITKPFAIEELLARIRVVFKKRGADRSDSGHAFNKDTPKLSAKGVTLDEERHEVMCQGEEIELTHREYELLKTLLQNKNIVLDREKLLNMVCGYDYIGETNIIDVYVRYLRTKIDDRFGIKLISTIRGVGYAIKDENRREKKSAEGRSKNETE